MWQSPPFPNYGEPFSYRYLLSSDVIDMLSARGKLAVFPQIKNGELFESLYIDHGVHNGVHNYTPTYFIDENLDRLIANYRPLFGGELLYVLGLEFNGDMKYFDTSFLFCTESNAPITSVAGLEENNVAYKGFSLFGEEIKRYIVVPNNSFVLSLYAKTGLSLRYEFGEEEIYKLGGFNLIVKKPISYTVISSLPKVELPLKGILELHFK